MAEETQVVETVEEQVVPEAKQPQDEKVYRCRCGRYYRQKVCEVEVRTRS